ncbi:sunset domain-containing protein [Serinicoccus kebangsaanensis]|uniref:sunset domain-containing protein n=1 Tax=Serinicoccus kebangsaanensis TaxID=2602069 RepID=UPI00124E11D7|nr:hypothetical protein [Serinicoccus kebangsaanensis]
MDSPTTWIMLILLLLLIGVVVFWLLRRPGDDGAAALDARDQGRLDGPDHGGLSGAEAEAGSTTGYDPTRPSPGQTGPAPVGEPVGGTESHQPVTEPGTHDEGIGAGPGPSTDSGESPPPVESRYDTAPPPPAAEVDDPAPADTGATDTYPDQAPPAGETVDDGVGTGTASGETAPATEDFAAESRVDEGTAADDVDEDDPGRWREAAAIGAVGAAGGAAVVGSQEDEAGSEAPADPATEAAATPAGAVSEEATTTAEPTDGVHALSDEEFTAGASEEPLPMEDQAPSAEPETTDAASAEPLTADEVLDAQGETSDEFPVGDSSTTYRADEGEAVVVEESDAGRYAQPEQGTLPDTPPAADEHTGATDTPVTEERHADQRWSDDTASDLDGQSRSWTDEGTSTGSEPVVEDQQAQTWTERGTATGTDASWTEESTPTAAAPVTDDQQGQTWSDQATATGTEPDLQDEPAQTWADGGDDAAVPAPPADPADTEATVAPAGTEEVDETVAPAGAETEAPVAPTTPAAEAEAPVFAESIYGAGSAEPLEDGTGPAGWAIKGNAGSMLFHTPESPSYDGVRAEVWFESEEAARAAGFAHWDRRQR